MFLEAKDEIGQLSGSGERLLLGEGAIDLVAQMLRQLDPELLAFGRK